MKSLQKDAKAIRHMVKVTIVLFILPPSAGLALLLAAAAVFSDGVKGNLLNFLGIRREGVATIVAGIC
jgi:hypothetical protein